MLALQNKEPASVAQSDARPTGDQRSWVRSLLVWPHFIMEIDHEIFSSAISFLPLIQDRQLSVSGERMYTSTG